ncbi:MAG: acetoacetate decarboxylase family protein [Luminiphilus sp.]|nr:acetoacetate decarboxylase family protein [Luminiphilus sp.]
MPAHFGPRYTGEKTSGWYHDVTVVAVPFKTERDKLAALLPAGFQLADEAVVTVYYACNKNIDWLAGRGYNMVGVNARTVFVGADAPMEGNYSLVIWENLTDPILVGREVQGIPKIYAEIPDHQIHEGVWRCSASHFDNKIVDLCAEKFVEVRADEVSAAMRAQAGKEHPLTWRYLPAVGGFGAPSLSEVVTFPSENIFDSVMVGEGSVTWNTLTWEENPTQFHIVNTMERLPVVEYLPAILTRGRTNLVLPENWTRSLAPMGGA